MGVLLTMLVGALATTLAFVPAFLMLPSEDDRWQAWLMLGAAPLAAFVVNLLLPAATTGARAVLTGLPQILLCPLLVNIDVGMDNSRGYFVGGELDMARTFGFIAGLIFGFILTVLVAAGAMLGTQLGGRRR